MKRSKALRFRQAVDYAAGLLTDTQADEHRELFLPWAPDITYAAGDRRTYNGGLYRCVQAHTSQADWAPDKTPALWVRCADPGVEWPEWVQPTGSHDAYDQGAKVSHGGKHWTSDIPNNVYEPGVYGWTEAIS